MYVKQFIDSNMAYADSLSALIPRSILTVKNTTVPMGKFIQERQDHPIDKSVDEIYELENQVLAEFNYVLYLFDFGGTRNHPYSLGAAVSPDRNYIIYFCQQG